jgi:Amt family ammonium transporter
MVCEANQYLLTNVDDLTTACFNYSSPNEKLAGLMGDDAIIDSGNTAWMLAGTALVMIMTPGLGFFYAGMVGEDTAVNTLMMSMVSMAIVTVQWLVVGYSFAFGPGNVGFGSFAWAFFVGVGTAPSGAYGVRIPHLVFAIFQCMFAQITPALISGSVVGRMKFSSYCVFVLLWTTLVYDPLAHWVWAFSIDAEYAVVADGWLGRLGAIDFAGGTVIHIASGFSALAAVFVLGNRYNAGEKLRPHNVPLVVLGTAMLWFGWFGFNAASAVAANGQASNAFVTTHIATAMGFLTWMALEQIVDGSMSAPGACAGAVAGLVCITPGCGFVTPWAALFFGLFASIFCFGTAKLKHKVGLDDTLDAFCVHGVGGVVGAFLTGLFATTYNTGGIFYGAFYGNPMLLGYQMAAICTAAAFSFTGTYIILYFLHKTMGIRVSPDVERSGLDSSLHGGESYAQKGSLVIAARNSKAAEPASASTAEPSSITQV